MQEKIKEILGVFLKMPGEQIVATTAIDRSALGSSILLHRMYAKLAAAGIEVKDYQQVRVFGDLVQRVNGLASVAEIPFHENVNGQSAEAIFSALPGTVSGSIGIDIEKISAMPVTGDFREDAFYAMNFSGAEIAYCILQPDSYASFAGLFAAKEAMVKADNRLKTVAFRNIPIQHLAAGKPFHAGFNLSISHTDGIAVAVAIPVQATAPLKETTMPAKPGKGTPVIVWLLLLTSLVLSLVALLLTAGKK